MPDYDFRTLSPIDFEILIRDILQEELGIRLESFKVGSDQGIDFRYCPSRDHKLIIQAKRYIDTNYKSLLRILEQEEAPKVEDLSPSRYILATSLGLSPAQKDEIKSLFHPYILSTGDVLGRDDLNGLLSRHPKIERQHFKLWMMSLPIFEDILHSKIKNASRDELEKIRDHARYYVQNESFGRALKILDEHHLCIIAGIPGIGKTILAEMLALYFINLGYEMVKVTGDIAEASAFDYVNQKRIFYYDDFLGQTSLVDKLNKNEDQRLLDFMYAVHRSKVSKLILTTREYILNQAKMAYEKLAAAQFNLQTCIIDISSYTRRIRARILYNHLYFSGLSDSFKQAVLAGGGYIPVIDHRNYNPRIIQFMTDPLRIGTVAPSDYWKVFRANLDNPADIWKHAFELQISQASRHLLFVLATLPLEVFREDGEKAFDMFHRNQAKAHGHAWSGRDFEQALRELEGNFIVISRSKGRILLKFHNPSVRDFLSNYIIHDYAILRELIESSLFHEQLTWLWETFLENKEKLKPFPSAEQIANDILRRVPTTMSGPSCQLINSRDSDGTIYKKVWSSSFEEKAILILNIVVAVMNPSTRKSLDQVVAAVDTQTVNSQAHRRDLVRFFKIANSSKLLDIGEHASLLYHAKVYLMGNLEWVDDYEAFCDFAELFPDVVTPEDFVKVKREFEGFAEGSAEDIDDSDPDAVRQHAEELQALGERLSADVSKEVARLEALANEIEEDTPPTPDDDYDHDEVDGGHESYSDAEIASMFATM